MSQTTSVKGTAVAVDGRALLIQGRSGSGKSSLALELMSRGAVLVADDLVVLSATADSGLLASAPYALEGVIEARGMGLLKVPHTIAAVFAVVDLEKNETERLPSAHETVIAGARLPCLRKVESPAFAAMLIAYLKGGRRET